MGADTWFHMRDTVTFEEIDGGVRMTIRIDASDASGVAGAAGGWRSTLDRFAERLGS